MKQKSLKVLISFIIVFMLVGCSSINKTVDLTDVPKEYEPDAAVKNGDVVNVHGKVSNIDRLDRLIENVNKGQQDEVRVTSYTIEGDAILHIIIIDGKTIECIYDNSRDKFGATDKGIKKYRISKIWKEDEQIDMGEEKKADYTTYFLSTEKGEKRSVITIRKQ